MIDKQTGVRVKGIEFDRMILAGMRESNMPWSAVGRSEDDSVQADAEKMERALLYVAITRASKWGRDHQDGGSSMARDGYNA